MNDSDLTLAARYLFPVLGPPIGDGTLTIRNGRIAWLGPRHDRHPDLDLGNVALLPGLVNAHTHLDLGGLRGRIPPRPSFIHWLGEVVEFRRALAPQQIEPSIRRGISESLAAGTTLAGDISADGASWPLLAASPLRSVVFYEVLGLRPERARETWAAAAAWLDQVSCFNAGLISPGLSPHAPYSTSGSLYQAAAELAAARRMPLATHLAESVEELELLRGQSGPLGDFLEALGAWHDQWRPLGTSPLDYLRALSATGADCLIVHGNYLPPHELDPLWSDPTPAPPPTTQGLRRGRLAVVYCARTHDYFGHPPHPWVGKATDRIRVCLGTDSLASNPDLSILEEMRFVHRRYEWLAGQDLLAMGTFAGAWAVRREHELGSLAPGKRADLCAVALPNHDDKDPYRLLWRSQLPVAGTMIGGRWVFGPQIT